MWNQFLNQSRSQHKHKNTNLIILGNRHSGKRSLIDSLFDISKTTIQNKRIALHADTNKMRLKGITAAIDYAYLNVLDINDPDNKSHTKLQIFMIQEAQNPSIYKQISKKEILKSSMIIIMLDYTNPWNFMSELKKWVKFIYDLIKNAQFTISQLDQMKNSIQQDFKRYKEPELDQFGKLKKNFQFNNQKQNERIQIPIPEGCLKNNLRMPFIICVNKCDLMSMVLRDQSTNKIMFVLYHLRKFCIQYGGSLIYTSIKNNINLDLLYEYILLRSYKMPFKYKPDLVNQQGIFIPMGFDNLTLLNDSFVKVDVNKPYEQVIVSPNLKKIVKQEIIVQQDHKYFEKYAISSSSSHQQSISNSSVSQKTNGTIHQAIEKSQKSDQNTKAADFFKKLLNKDKDKQKKDVGSKTLDQKNVQIKKKQQQQ